MTQNMRSWPLTWRQWRSPSPRLPRQPKRNWALHQALVAGTPPVAAACKEYFQYRDRMYPREGVLLFEDRLVIPAGLRPKVLTVLHAPHQGKSMMLHRAADTVFWPGYTTDVEKKRASCRTCNRTTPTQRVPVDRSSRSKALPRISLTWQESTTLSWWTDSQGGWTSPGQRRVQQGLGPKAS